MTEISQRKKHKQYLRQIHRIQSISFTSADSMNEKKQQDVLALRGLRWTLISGRYGWHKFTFPVLINTRWHWLWHLMQVWTGRTITTGQSSVSIDSGYVLQDRVNIVALMLTE